MSELLALASDLARAQLNLLIGCPERKPPTPEAHYDTSLEAFGGEWSVTIGYRVTDYGTPARSYRNRSGETEIDEGQAPTIQLCSLKLGSMANCVDLPLDMLSTTQQRVIEEMIATDVEREWA